MDSYIRCPSCGFCLSKYYEFFDNAKIAINNEEVFNEKSPMAQYDIEKLILLHESDSRSVPFFLKSDAKQVEQYISNKWKLEINTNNTIKPKSIRIVIYNVYWRAERNQNERYDSVSLKAIHIGGDFMIIDKIKIDESDNNTNLLSLERAIGNSPTMISITPGAAFKVDYTEFSTYEVDKAVDFIQTLKLV